MRYQWLEMMANTDDMTECMFTVGSVVSCVTCFDVNIEGEVIAFDYNKRLLVLKSSGGHANTNDVNWINLEFVKDIVIKKEVKREDVLNTQLPQINTQKVEHRARVAIDERRKLAEAFNSGISADGVKLYLSLTKTFDVTVSWDSDNIIVANSVKIYPPYRVDNCISIKHTASPQQQQQLPEALKFSKKLVEKYWNDKQKQNVSTKTSNSVSTNDKPQFNNKG